MTANNDLVVQLQKLLTAIDRVLQTPTKDGAIQADSKPVKQLIEEADKATKFLVGKD